MSRTTDAADTMQDEGSAEMGLEPTVVERAEQPYVGITSTVTMRELGERLPPLMDVLFSWLAERSVAPAGPPFWKYNVIDMSAGLEVVVGVPVAQPVAGDGQVQAAVLPAGRYVVASHVGHPDLLEQATGELLDWAKAEGLQWDVVDRDGEEFWVARLEEYLNGPDDQPDMDKWETNLIFKLAD